MGLGIADIMKCKFISKYFAVFTVLYNFDHIYCAIWNEDKSYVLTTSDNPGWSMLPRELISDKYSEITCMREHMKCLGSNVETFKWIGAWDIFNSKWKFHTICEIKNSKCVLDKTAYRYNISGYNTWILV